MAGSLGVLNIQLALDQVQFQQNLTKAQQKAKQFSDKTTQYLGNIEKAAQSINRSTNWSFISAIGNLGFNSLSSGAQKFIHYADSYTEIGNRMKLISSNSVESARAMQAVFDISMRTNQSVDATGQVYQRFAQNAQQLGISQSKVASLTETVSKAVAISGASAASAQAALMQFGQSLASGVFRGQEFNSVMDLAQTIARGLGVTTSEVCMIHNQCY
ncbi:tape measure protein [Chelonobacter oris]|uniref:tape measure protein n=1 Tax=Chelonobacter oris TaxID=505317 RepID=UPI00068998D3|nr:tape measure protein [Chelonobacter oris]